MRIYLVPDYRSKLQTLKTYGSGIRDRELIDKTTDEMVVQGKVDSVDSQMTPEERKQAREIWQTRVSNSLNCLYAERTITMKVSPS